MMRTLTPGRDPRLLIDDSEPRPGNRGRRPRVAGTFRYLGEEDCLRGQSGFGTVFFASPDPKRAFRPSGDISARGVGRGATGRQIARPMLRLRDEGGHHIDFATPGPKRFDERRR